MALTRTVKAGGGGTQLKPGTYRVTCTDVKTDFIENAQFGTGDVIRFELETEDAFDAEGNPATLDAIANDKLTPKAKLTRWLEAFGVRAEVGQDLDIEDCIGRDALAKVIAKLDENGHDTGFSKVDDLMPPVGQQVVKDPQDMDVGEWWAEVRSAGHSIKDGREKAHTMFQRDPKDLTGKERADVLAAL